ncbi:carotenoid oxygenase [Pyxidicoccus fallax]|uniref:Carotenoid oxygenase n=1 Tax=Pyxidicoccus fallax TaxID=394095 RepID=A0A848LK34_9BACT|nr:carotenoid oxygenase family protein [Pyxidicoccus fallax]NMO18125.1 carotenoid oxygenase [Pyxidicoccus fallax]NPC79419.1 carotenoid oxygenase [Pyxidicoccus fallax]
MFAVSASSSPSTPKARGLRDVSAPSWFRAFAPLPREHGFEPLRVEGILPEDLQGTLYRVGPAAFSAHGQRYGHWFDGDGAVSAVRFAGRSAHGATRFVETQHRAHERREGKMLYGRYGTVIPGGPLHRLRALPYNAANTALMHWQDRLFALHEQSHPTEVDPDSLHTLGATDLHGIVQRAFSAHPRRVPSRKATYNFGARYGPGFMWLDLFELPDVGAARRLCTLKLPGLTLLHDFIATDRYLVFLVPPMKLPLLRMVLGLGTLADGLALDTSRGTEVIVVPIDDPERPVRFTVDPFFLWHFANAFEERGHIVLDIVRYADASINLLLGEFITGHLKHPPTGMLHRLRIDPVRQRLSSEQRWDRPCEFPHQSSEQSCRDGRYLYLLSSSPEGGLQPPDQLAKVDHHGGAVETVSPGPGQYPSEPVFVPRRGATGEDDGYLLTLVYDSRRHASHVAVFDARRFTRAPLARVWFDHHLPFTVHGLWVPRERG